MKKENYEHCRSIIESMEAYYNGIMYSYNGEEYNTDELEITENEEGEEGYIIEGEFVSIDDMEQLSLWNYFSDDDIYDIKYTIDGNKEYCGVRLMVACGGPNVYINTISGDVELYWWGDDAKASMSSDLIREIDTIWEEYYNCL